LGIVMMLARMTPARRERDPRGLRRRLLDGDVVPGKPAIELRRLLRVASEKIEPDELAGHGRALGRVSGVGFQHAEQRALVVAEERVDATAFEHRRRDHDLAPMGFHVLRRERGVGHRHQRKPTAALRRTVAARAEVHSADVARLVFDQRVASGAGSNRMKVPAEYGAVEGFRRIGIGGHAIEPDELAGDARSRLRVDERRARRRRVGREDGGGGAKREPRACERPASEFSWWHARLQRSRAGILQDERQNELRTGNKPTMRRQRSIIP
jgi:hypothetical protein